jgi:hypothetical protein
VTVKAVPDVHRCQCPCARALLDDKGNPDWSRKFFDTECRNWSKRVRMRASRLQMEDQRRLREMKKASAKAKPAFLHPEPHTAQRFFIRNKQGIQIGVVFIATARSIAKSLGKDLAAVLIDAEPAFSMAPRVAIAKPAVKSRKSKVKSASAGRS